MVVDSALPMPPGHLHHLGRSVGLTALLPVLLPIVTNQVLRPSPFNLNKKTKAGTPKKGASLSKYLPCCPGESLRPPLCVAAQAQVVHPQPALLDVASGQASPSLTEAGLEQPSVLPRDPPGRL